MNVPLPYEHSRYAGDHHAIMLASPAGWCLRFGCGDGSEPGRSGPTNPVVAGRCHRAYDPGRCAGRAGRDPGGFPVAAAVAVAPALAVVLLRSVWSGFTVIAVACIRRLASCPGGPITPTLLELALIYCLLAGSAVALWIACDFVGWSEALVLVLIGIATVAFLLGIGQGYTARRRTISAVLLAIGMF